MFGFCGSEDPSNSCISYLGIQRRIVYLNNAQDAENQVLLARQKKSDLESSISVIFEQKLHIEKHTALPEL